MNAFTDAVVEPLLVLLGDWSWRWAVLIAVLALGLRLVRPRSAALRRRLCAAVLLAGLSLPLVPRWGPGWTAFPAGAAAEPSAPVLETDTPQNPVSEVAAKPLVARRNADPRRAVAPDADAEPRPHAPPAREPEPLGVRRIVALCLAGAWAAGVAFLLLRWVIGSRVLRRLRRTAVPVAGPAAELLAGCRTELGVRISVALASHPGVRSPVLFGPWRPMIVVPVDWHALPPAARRAALLHELAHVARGDHRRAPLWHLVRVVFFFHPLARWLLARLESETEILCDEAAVAHGIAPHDYARILLEFAGRGGRLGPALLRVGRRSTVTARIHHLLEEDMQHRLSPRPQRRALLLGTMLVGLMAALGSLRIGARTPEEPPPPKSPPAADAGAAEAPKKPYRIAPFDVLRIHSSGTLPDQPLDGLRLVEPDGKVDLGSSYGGRIPVEGRTLEEATEAILKRLKTLVRQPEVSVELAGWVSRWRRDPARKHPYHVRPFQVLNIEVANTPPGMSVTGPHLVDPDGKVDLGPALGKVAVEGLTLEEATAAVEKHLRKRFKEPAVSVTLGGWEKIWHDLVRDGPEEPKAPPAAAAEKGVVDFKAFRPADVPDKSVLRYEGKSFEQWRTELLTELSPKVRAQGMKALSTLGANGYGAEAMRAILQVVQGYAYDPGFMSADEHSILQAALEACGKINEPAVPVLREALRSPNRNVRRFAAAGLAEVGARDAVADVIKLVADKDAVVRKLAVQAVGRLGPKAPGAVKALAGALKDESDRVREAAADALRGSAAKAAIPALVEALKDSDRDVRSIALSSLIDLKGIGPALAPALVPLLSDEDLNLRVGASNVLQALGPGAREVVPALIAVLHKRDVMARIQAIRVLGAIGPDAKAAIPALKDLLGAKSDDLTQELLKALGEIEK
jgi:HEAT repeat protein/beta-lactamase regulating signal transducer with metallopeptidase domain/protein involved in polysaccharide export with SLBB domain